MPEDAEGQAATADAEPETTANAESQPTSHGEIELLSISELVHSAIQTLQPNRLPNKTLRQELAFPDSKVRKYK